MKKSLAEYYGFSSFNRVFSKRFSRPGSNIKDDSLYYKSMEMSGCKILPYDGCMC